MKWCRLELKKKTDSFLPNCTAPQPLLLTLTRTFLRKFRAFWFCPQTNPSHLTSTTAAGTGTGTLGPPPPPLFTLTVSPVTASSSSSASVIVLSAQLRFRRRPSRSGASCHRLVVVLQVSNPSPHSPIAASASGLRLLSRASAAVPVLVAWSPLSVALNRSPSHSAQTAQIEEEETMIFTNEQRQQERTGKYGSPRFQYLQELVTQFQNTTDEETKERILANLANFAYDPYNYNFLRQLNVLELFLDCMTEPNEKLVEFGVGGICNCCADQANVAIVSKFGGIPLIIQCLSSPVRNTVNYALGALYYICNEFNKEEILKPEVVDTIKSYIRRSSNLRSL
nr:uncharacterized protein LOC112765468 isoform X2 [Arachis hypogaea]